MPNPARKTSVVSSELFALIGISLVGPLEKIDSAAQILALLGR